MKIGVTTTALDAARLIAQAKEIAARRRAEDATRTQATEVIDGERELGAATGDLRVPDER